MMTQTINNHRTSTEDMLQLRKLYPTGKVKVIANDDGRMNLWFQLHIINPTNKLQVNWFAVDPKVCKDMFAAEELRTQMKSEAAKKGWENRRIRLEGMSQ
mgnify:CR=1 FL=1